jgi:hypothetical protein
VQHQRQALLELVQAALLDQPFEFQVNATVVDDFKHRVLSQPDRKQACSSVSQTGANTQSNSLAVRVSCITSALSESDKAPPGRFERPACGFEVRRSVQLSYGGNWCIIACRDLQLEPDSSPAHNNLGE